MAASENTGSRVRIRALHGSEELEPWGALCARGFSHRPGAPDRFLRKYLADPTASLAWIRVAVEGDSDVPVGNIRLYDRTWEVAAGKHVGVVGLGEVCTDPSMRGKGISTVMLQDAVDMAEAHAPAAFAALHAAAGVSPLYARFGFGAVHVPYAAAAIPEDGAPSGAAPSFTRRQPEWGADWETLDRLHTAAIRRMDLVGCTVRNAEYWRLWMPHVTAGQLWLYEGEGAGVPAEGASPAAHRTLAYLAVALKPEGFKLIDFGVDDACDAATLAGLLSHAGAAAWAAEEARGGAAAVAGVARRVLVPARLAALLGSSMELTADDAFVDRGWMLRQLHGDGAPVAALTAAASEGRFLVWPADSF